MAGKAQELANFGRMRDCGQFKLHVEQRHSPGTGRYKLDRRAGSMPAFDCPRSASWTSPAISRAVT